MYKKLYKLTWPIFLEILLFMLMGVADTLMLSNYSDNAVAAVGVANQIFNLLGVLLNIVATGSAILIAQYLGAKSYDRSRDTAATSVLINTVFGLILTIIMFVSGKMILKVMNVPVDIFDTSYTYTLIITVSMVFIAIRSSMSAVLRTYGHPKVNLFTSLFVNTLNIIGNAVLIYGLFGAPRLGATGAAISTTISRIIGVIVITIFFLRYTKIKKQNFLNTNRKTVSEIIKIGLPNALENFSWNLTQIVLVSFIAIFGTVQITTRVYAYNVLMFVFLLNISIMQSSQVLIGNLVGEYEFDEAYKLGLNVTYISMAITLVLSIIVYFNAEPIIRLLTDNEDIIKLTKTIFLIAIVGEQGRALNLITKGALIASGDVKYVVYMGIIVMWVIGIPLAYVLGVTLEMGIIGIWISTCIDEIVRGFVALSRWKSKKWTKKVLV